MSEIFREIWEMGHLVHPKSMQNKDVSQDDNFETKEIINYQYCLESRDDEDFLFLFDKRSQQWVKEEFKERIHSFPNKYYEYVSFSVNPGEAYKIREELWVPFLVDGKFDYTYSERLSRFDTLYRVIEEIKKNPDSRQLILSIWDKSDICNIGGKKRIPCSVYYQILIRGEQLHIVYNQRSADVVAHLGNDVWLAWELGKFIAEKTGYQMGYLYHNITSLHCYKKDWDILLNGISLLGKGII